MEKFNDNFEDDEIKINEISPGKYQHVFFVPKMFYHFILGQKGSVLKKICYETKTRVKIPPRNDKNETIVITGSDLKSILRSRKKIDMVIKLSKEKITTHIISIPLNTEQMMENFEKFKSQIVDDPVHISKGINDEAIFIDAKRLHLTIGNLALTHEKEEIKAQEAFRYCVENIIEPILNENSPLTIRIQGCEYVNDDSTKVGRLFGKIVENSLLQKMSDQIVDYYTEKGLMDSKKILKRRLHVSLTITTNRRRKERETKPSCPEKYDVEKILKDYENYFFGEISFTTINISKIRSEDEDGHYVALIKKDFV